jgi:biotin-dependent carboxylase-like uncharacterized protein
MTLRVLEPGLHTLVVDFGRPGHRSLGIPLGGAADRASLTFGNALLGNPPHAAGLEINLRGPTLEAECDLACVIYGPRCELHADLQELVVGRTFTLQAGERLHIGVVLEGARAYFCVGGGLQTPLILGSRSALLPLRSGEQLACRTGTTGPRSIHPITKWDHDWTWFTSFVGPAHLLRVLDAPQTAWFPSAGIFLLADGSVPPPLFTIRAESNRMGLRLQGDPLPWPQRELVSEPVCPGSVQVTPDGQCIILGVDGQTIGGYPKIAQVISSDLDRIGQMRPGEEVYFVRVDLNRAEALQQAKALELREWTTRLRVSLGG